MDVNEEMKAMMPDLINGKTHEQLTEENAADNQKLRAHFVIGIKLTWMVPPSNVELLKTFEVRNDDVYINTYTRSGTHWMLEIVNFILHAGRVDFDRTFLTSALETTLEFDPSKIESTVPGPKIFANLKSPRCIATHCPEVLWPPQLLEKAKVVYVARNPKDMIVSLFKLMPDVHPITSRPVSFEEYLWKWYYGELTYGSWFDHVLGGWRRKDNPNFLFIKYEDLQKDLRGSVCKVAKHLGKDLSDDIIDGIVDHVTFSGMQKTYKQLENERGREGNRMTQAFGVAPYLRKGQVGDWKNTFTVEQSSLFDKIYALKMRGTDLEFDFEL